MSELRLGDTMYKTLQSAYGRLLLIPRIGPLFRIPVLTWRAIFGGETGRGMTPSVQQDSLSLTIAAVDGLRHDVTALQARLAEQADLHMRVSADMKAEIARQAKRADEMSLIVSAVDGLRGDTTALREQVEEHARLHAGVSTAMREEIAATEAWLRERIEFARAEAMFELRAKLPGGIMPTVPGAATAAPVVAARILAPDKLRAMQAAGALRVNVGCGHIPLDAYLNTDMRELPGVDVVADAAGLPFEPGTLAEIHSAHLLEHFPIEHLRRVVLPHWRSLLRQGGELRAVVPDAEAMLADFAAREMSFDDLREVTYGLQDYDGDYHFNMFSRDQLAGLLREAGFVEVAFAAQGRRNGKCREMEIRGIRT
jgi:predicted SAM-dependent methyltransferase